MKPPLRPILVFAGTVRQGRDWIVSKGYPPAWFRILVPRDLPYCVQGEHGNAHVIVGGQLERQDIEQFAEVIAMIQSDPWEDPDETPYGEPTGAVADPPAFQWPDGLG